jgi:hypothetical protein
MSYLVDPFGGQLIDLAMEVLWKQSGWFRTPA